MKFEKIVKGVMWLGVLGIALAAFVLSFDVLRNEAVKFGVNPKLAWMFPIIIDGVAVIFTFFSVYGSISKNKAVKRYGYSLIVIVTIVSVGINATHAGGWRGVIFFVAPPVLLALCIHGLSMILGVEVSTQAKQSKRVKKQSVTPLSLNPSGDTKDISPKFEMNETVSKTVTVTGKMSVTDRQMQVLRLFTNGVTTQRGIAKEIGVAAPTVKRDLDALFSQGALQKSESGCYMLAGQQ